MNCICRYLICFVFLHTSLAQASEKPRTLTWANLVPTMNVLKNPFKSITTDQFYDLQTIITARDMRKKNQLSEVHELYEEALETRYKLVEQGLEVDKLISIYDRFKAELLKRNKMTNPALNNQNVRIPGYALPLDHHDKGVQELLLVPYFGACIHVPPPPANQIVFVKLKHAYKPKDLYEPVWIYGRLTIVARTKTLSLVDGSSGVDTAYTLDAKKIEPYEE